MDVGLTGRPRGRVFPLGPVLGAPTWCFSRVRVPESKCEIHVLLTWPQCIAVWEHIRVFKIRVPAGLTV